MADNADEVRLTLRLPAALRDRLTKEAEASGRSLNAEMVQRLEKTLVDDDSVIELWNTVEDMKTQLSELWADYQRRLDPFQGRPPIDVED